MFMGKIKEFVKSCFGSGWFYLVVGVTSVKVISLILGFETY